jgi:hypothetical protein
MKRQIYIMRGNSPKDWSEQQPLGPYESENQARQGIRHDLQACLECCETLSPGRLTDWAESYTLVEVVKRFQPTITVKADIILANAEL